MAARRRPGRLCRLAAGDRSEDSANHKLHQCVCPDHRMPQLAHRGLAQVALVLAVALDPVLGRCPAPSQFDRIFWVRSRSRLPAPKHGRLPGPGIFHLRRLQLGLDSAGCPMPEATPCPKRPSTCTTPTGTTLGCVSAGTISDLPTTSYDFPRPTSADRCDRQMSSLKMTRRMPRKTRTSRGF